MTRTQKQALGIFAVAALFYFALSYLIALRIGRPLGQLSVFFDGHLYLSIARSFPLPYSEHALDYAGHSPGYPAVAWLSHVLLPNSIVDWGVAMLVALWLPAAAAVGLFFLVLEKLETPPWIPTLAFGLANPVWLLSAATPHAEPLAIALLLAALLAHLNGRAAWAGLALGLAVMTRLPSAVLGAWLFFGILAASSFRPQWRIVHSFWSIAAFVGLNAYLYWRIPSFEGISDAHSVFWNTSVIWPFSALIVGLWSELWAHPGFEITYGLLTLYFVAMGCALWTRDRPSLELGIWLLLTAGAAASFRGIMGLWDYPRLSIAAWPAAVLIVARTSRNVQSRAATAAVCLLIVVGTSVGLWSLLAEGRGPYKSQPSALPWLEREMASLDRDTPRWVDFRTFHRQPRVPVYEPDGREVAISERKVKQMAEQKEQGPGWIAGLVGLVVLAVGAFVALGGVPLLRGKLQTPPEPQAAVAEATAPSSAREALEAADTAAGRTRIAENGRLTIALDELTERSGGPLRFALDLTDDARGSGDRAVKVISEEGERIDTQASSLPGAGAGVLLELEPDALAAGRYMIEIETVETSHPLRIRRYVLELE